MDVEIITLVQIGAACLIALVTVALAVIGAYLKINTSITRLDEQLKHEVKKTENCASNCKDTKCSLRLQEIEQTIEIIASDPTYFVGRGKTLIQGRETLTQLLLKKKEV